MKKLHPFRQQELAEIRKLARDPIVDAAMLQDRSARCLVAWNWDSFKYLVDIS